MSKRKQHPQEASDTAGYYVKRGFAFIVDWYFSSVLINLLVRLSLMITGWGSGKGEIVTYDARTKTLVIFISLVVAFLYYVLIPWRSEGQGTVMMKVLKLRVLSADGNLASFQQHFIRYFVGCFLLQGVLFSSFNSILQVISHNLSQDIRKFMDPLIGGVGIFFVLLSLYLGYRDKAHHRMLQDRIAGTILIEQEEGK